MTSKWTSWSIRELERTSIREFVSSSREFLEGRHVIDVGAGLQPYRDLVERMGCEYVPYDLASYPANVSGQDFAPPAGRYGAVLCTQVIQYVPYPSAWLDTLKLLLEPGGNLVLTYPCSWDEIEADDLFRYTKAGMGRLLLSSGWELLRNEHRAHVELGGFKFYLGGGVVATPKGGR